MVVLYLNTTIITKDLKLKHEKTFKSTPLFKCVNVDKSQEWSEVSVLIQALGRTHWNLSSPLVFNTTTTLGPSCLHLWKSRDKQGFEFSV